jgi:hypothetical protein
MKRLIGVLLPLVFLVSALPLAAKDAQAQFKTIVVNRFANANTANQSQEFINYFSASLSERLLKLKAANQVLGEGVGVTPADAADSLVVEGRFTDFDKGGMFVPGKLGVDINIFRASDHALVKNITTKLLFKGTPLNKDKNVAEFTGEVAAQEIRQGLKNTSLSSIAPAAAPAVPAAAQAMPGAAASAAQAGELSSSAQLNSNPDGGEITVDGNYAGNTPSLIKLKPGTHSIKLTKTGYQPWVRSIEISAGESRTFTADLEK